MRASTVLIVGVLAALSCVSTVASAQMWKVTHTEWTDQDERDYSAFVAAIGDAREKKLCKSALECILNAPGNFLRTPDDYKINLGVEKTPNYVDVDCAFLPYFLRTYFAAKRGLPFSIINKIEQALGPNGETSANPDIRYSAYGNVPVRRRDFASGRFDLNEAIRQARWGTSSANYRINVQYDSYDLPTDMYSVELRKASNDLQGIRPGTNIYDPNGHVAVIYKIGRSGRIFYIDAHPGNLLTRGSYGAKFARSSLNAGAGFRNWRPLRVSGGQVTLSTNGAIPDFSLEQFVGNVPDPGGNWKRGRFVFNGRQYVFYDYVRLMMANGNPQIEPLSELGEMLDGLCLDLEDRVEAIRGTTAADQAVKASLRQQPAPVRWPTNLYGASGTWEVQSSPSRDARLKASFQEVRDSILKWEQMLAAHDPDLVYSGFDLKADLRAVYQRALASCPLHFENSAGQTVNFTIDQANDHLFDFSFSPYECVELRWGGLAGVPASCLADPAKAAWYQASRKVRNQIERTYDAKMDYTAAELLRGPGASLGVETPPDVSIRRVLQ